MNAKRGFASDNNSGVHSDIIKAIQEVNSGHTIGYGSDKYTEKALQKFKQIFGKYTETYFVFTGTAANVLGLSAVTKSYHSIICAETAHINEDECGAPEKFTGCKVLTAETPDGKLTPDLIKKHLYGFDFEHHSQPKIISITQATEMGTVYKPDEIKQITDFAHKNKMLVHMDGARISNAAVSLNLPFKAFTTDVGLDILSFGGTKNGMMYGEAVVFFNSNLAPDFKYIRKQGMQLASKMRFIGAQFLAFFENDLWKKNAKHSNEMAQYLVSKVKNIPAVKITQPVEANGVFAIVPKQIISELQKEFFFYMWDENKSEVRWMTSFDTTKEDVDQFAEKLKALL
ncbi:MAG: low specificity L-threonine aldolase [Chlorobi bacterium]|nr:low specificity L-threonine aldolase [Chlorobiota bacterium]